jgi:Uma2 family endonuclease
VSVMTIKHDQLEVGERLWTVEDVLAMEEHPARARHELVDGVLIMSPAPMWPHQAASWELTGQIKRAIRAAKAPFRVAEAVNVRTETQLFIPDIVVADAKAIGSDTVAVDVEAVLLIVEIVSPGHAMMDRTLKPTVYSMLGVPHFWRLEPGGREPRLQVHSLELGRYRQDAEITGTATVELGEELAVDVDVPELFADMRED